MSSTPSSLQPPPDAERRQLYSALVALCRKRGLGKVTSDQIARQAGLNPGVFDRHFADADDCFAQYLIDACLSFIQRAEAATEDVQNWTSRLRAVVNEIVSFLHADEDRAHMLLSEAPAAGPRGSLVRDEALAKLADLIDSGRDLMDDPAALTRITAEAISGALFNQMRLLQERGELEHAREFVPQLMYFLVLPYLGREAATQELSRPPMPGT